MSIKKIVFSFICLSFFLSCNGNNELSCDESNTTIKEGDNTKSDSYIKVDKVDRISNELVEKGQDLFSKNCAECHRMEYKSIGPDISDICTEHEPEWIINYLMNTDDTPTLSFYGKTRCPKVIDDLNETYALLDYFRQYRFWLHEFN